MTAQNNSEDLAEQAPHLNEKSLPGVGELLHKERERQGLTEKQVADDLHITMHYVRAIESNSFEKLPGNVFAKGYIKSYAVLLGMDVEPVMASYNAQMAKELDVAKEKTRIQVRKRKDRNRPWVIASAVLFVALFIGLWFVNYSNTEPAPVAAVVPSRNSATETPPVMTALAPRPIETAVPELGDEDLGAEMELSTNTELVVEADEVVEELIEVVQAELPEIAETGAIVNESSDESASSTNVTLASNTTAVVVEDQVIHVEAVGDDVLLISFSGESWVEVSDDSQGQVYRDLLDNGDVLEVKGTAPFNVLLGDAPFAELTLNGNAVDMSDDIRIDNSARFTVGLEP